jgi:hypothetical protein
MLIRHVLMMSAFTETEILTENERLSRTMAELKVIQSKVEFGKRLIRKF